MAKKDARKDNRPQLDLGAHELAAVMKKLNVPDQTFDHDVVEILDREAEHQRQLVLSWPVANRLQWLINKGCTVATIKQIIDDTIKARKEAEQS
jgi:hypothetical protein